MIDLPFQSIFQGFPHHRERAGAFLGIFHLLARQQNIADIRLPIYTVYKFKG